MKKIISFILIVFAINTNAQIVFEFDHDSASSFYSGTPVEDGQLMIINFEVSGEQYVNVNQWGKYISIYNMNHALVQTISMANFPTNNNSTTGNVLYLSEKLFNTDVKKEFMYLTNNSSSNCKTSIYNEDGTLLFSDTGSIPINFIIPVQQYPIYNTSQGTKMILSYHNNHAKVFGLAGTLTTAIDRSSHVFTGNMGNAYPNPTANATTIPYNLPQGINNGEVIFYNTQGTEVKRFKVDNTFSSLLISTADIPAGTYCYQLQTGGNASGTKKLIVIK